MLRNLENKTILRMYSVRMSIPISISSNWKNKFHRILDLREDKNNTVRLLNFRTGFPPYLLPELPETTRI